MSLALFLSLGLGLLALLGGVWVWRRPVESDWAVALLPPALRARWSRSPDTYLAPSSRVVTVLFVHVVGFATVAQKRSPEEAFRWLRRLLCELSDEVHQHGGIVDATVGDGVLAVFGYEGPEAPGTADHGDRALRCAVQMQINNGKRMMGAGEREEPVLPLRMGINTAPVYLGNLGQGKRVDFTLIGRGVNTAKQYEALCENHCILLGRSTRDVLVAVGEREVNFQARQISLRHGAQLHPVWEARPLWRHPSMAERANCAYRKFVEPDRGEERWGVPDGTGLRVVGPLGEGVIENFSLSGLGVRFSQFLGLGTPLTLAIEGPSPALGEALEEVGLSSLQWEVRWGSPCDEGGFRLGLHIQGATGAQRQQLLNLLRSALRQAKAA